MMRRQECIDKFPQVAEGMTVYAQDDEKLGTVVNLDEDNFTVEKGFFFPRDFTARYDDISEVSDDRIILSQKGSDLADWRSDSYAGWAEYYRSNYDIGASPTVSGTSTEEEVAMPVAEEKLETLTTAHQTGEVRLRKVVHTELVNLTIPVKKEEVIVERIPLNETRDAEVEGTMFQEQTVTMPVMEEEVEVRKRAVVKEEVRLRKTVRTEEQAVSDKVRKEEVVIEDQQHKVKDPSRKAS